jgi:hypothetical protein
MTSSLQALPGCQVCVAHGAARVAADADRLLTPLDLNVKKLREIQSVQVERSKRTPTY